MSMKNALLLSLALIAVGPVAVEGQDCVDLNTASLEQLDRIIHIGPARAAQIVTLRRQRRFESVDQIVRVRGIASARLRDIKAQGLACVEERSVRHGVLRESSRAQG
jgi:DNA uptake protein ComE-like DNA-binding protein